MAADSPLASMVPQQDEAPQVPQKTQSQDAISNILAMSREQSRLSQRALDMRRDELLRLSEQRMFDPRLMKFAGAMLSPTKTGSFGESLGYGATALAEEQEKEMARQQAMAKMQYEIEVESAKQKKYAAIPQLLMQMQQERAMPVMPSSPTAQPVAQPAQTTTQPAAQPAQATAQPAAQPQPKRARGAGGLLPNVSDEQLVIMSMDPDLKPLVDAEFKLREDRRKGREEFIIAGEKRFLYPEEVQEMQDLAGSGNIDGLRNFYRRINVPFNFIEDKSSPGGMRLATAPELEALKSKGVEAEKAKYGEQKEYSVNYGGRSRKLPFTPAQYVDYMDAESKGQGEEYINKLFKIKGTGTTGTAGTDTTTGDSLPKSKSQEELERKIEEERGTKRVVASEATRESLFESSRASRQLIQNSDQIIQLATDPKTKEIFGVFAKPGILNALGTIVAEGARVGNYSISLPSVENAMRKAGATEEEIKAAAVAARIFAQNELGFRRMFLSGQGSVSNMEGAVIPRFSGDLSDSAGAAQAKAEMTKARAELDAAAARVLREWERRPENAKKNFSDYEDSKEYNRLLDSYDAKLKKIMAVHFPGEKFDTKPNRPAGTSAPSRSSTSGDVSLEQNQPPGIDRKNKWLK
jgi:hypothetical protein